MDDGEKWGPGENKREADRERRVGRARRPSPTQTCEIRSRRRRSAAESLLTAAVSVGTDHRPFCCLLTDAALGLIALHIATRGEERRGEAISAPQTATCSDSQSGASARDSHEDTTLPRGPARGPLGAGGGLSRRQNPKEFKFKLRAVQVQKLCKTDTIPKWTIKQ